MRPDIHQTVLENLLDGAMVVERGGALTMFNRAAARILAIPPDEAAGTTFAELFVARDGFEEFSELILEAVAGEGDGSRQVVAVRVAGEERILSLATSYIRQREDGALAPVALIAVFSDVSEVERLRETELRLAKQAEAQHTELQRAYRQ